MDIPSNARKCEQKTAMRGGVASEPHIERIGRIQRSVNIKSDGLDFHGILYRPKTGAASSARWGRAASAMRRPAGRPPHKKARCPRKEAAGRLCREALSA